MVGGSLRIHRLLPPLKLVAIDIAEKLLKVALKHKKINQSKINIWFQQFDDLFILVSHEDH